MFTSKTLPILAISMATAAPASTQQPTATGSWQGAAVHEGATLPLSFRIVRDGAAVQVDIPSQGIFCRISPLRKEGGKLRIGIGRYSFELSCNLEAGTMRGDMRRRDVGGWVAKVELSRVPDVGVPAFTSEEVRFKSADGVTLTGMIVLPEGKGVHPGIVFVQGRSYGSRFQHYYDAVAAARRGIAGLIFDGRGVGRSEGVRGRHTRQQRLDDAAAALKTLRGHGQVDGKRVGLFGHSAGGWVIPVVAQHAGPVAFLVMHAGPAGTVAQQQGEVVRELSRRAGNLSDSELQLAYAYQHRLIELTTSGAPWTKIAAHVKTAEGQSWAGQADRPTAKEGSELDYFRRNPHDNTAALRATKIPLLAIYGGTDYIVPPQDNTQRLEKLLRAAGNEDFRIVVFPGAGHDLTIPEQDGTPYRWSRKPPGYYDTILDWVVARVGQE